MYGRMVKAMSANMANVYAYLGISVGVLAVYHLLSDGDFSFLMVRYRPLPILPVCAASHLYGCVLVCLYGCVLVCPCVCGRGRRWAASSACAPSSCC